MSTILKENLSVNKKGVVLISYKILKDFIDPTLKRIQYTFNDAENQIQIQIGISEKDVEVYVKNVPFQRRKFLASEYFFCSNKFEAMFICDFAKPK